MMMMIIIIITIYLLCYALLSYLRIWTNVVKINTRIDNKNNLK
jgi:hypothetical protein